MIRVDLETREVQASVRDLVRPDDDVPRPAGPLALARAELGTRVHQAYRAEREAGTKGFRAEVTLSLVREVDGFTARLRGRADGVVDPGDGTVVVEEVKSVAATGPELAALGRAGAGDLAEAKLQLRLYALCLACEEPAVKLRARLVLISIVDGARREVDVEFDAKRAGQRLDQLLRRRIAAAEAAAARARDRASLAPHLRFPYAEERPYQSELGAAVGAALDAGRPVLVQAPTGVGKTAAVLLPALRFVLERNATLFFLTAKNTQQALVARTFDDVAAAAGPAAECLRALTFREKRRMCPPGTLLCHPDHCAHLRAFLDRTRRERLLDELLEDATHVDPDVILAAGRDAEVCPYALALALSLRVDLVICDFNYVYDPAVAFRFFADDDPSADVRVAVVVDEAHNLFDRAREYYSPFLSVRDVRTLVTRVADGEFRAPGSTSKRGEPTLPGLLDPDAADGDLLFHALEEHLGALARHLDDTIASAEQSQPASIDGCRPIRPDPDVWQHLAARGAKLLVRYAHYSQAHALVRPEDPLVDVLRRVMTLRDLIGLEARPFVPYAASDPRVGPGAGVGILCVDPAEKLAVCHERVLGTVAMSATLEPHAYYADVLGFGRLAPSHHSFPSPFPEEHRRVVLVPTIGTTWRERKHHHERIARTIEDVVAVRPGNYVAYFPSFRFLADVRAHLKTPEASLLVQVPRMSPGARERVLAALRSTASPTLLFAVMGGVFAEGIDLPGEALIGAIVVGPALPPVGFERALMQHHFDETKGSGFAYAMLFPGLQRVIQAAGRVHRTLEDRGVIVLLGRRFARSPYVEHLPAWWSRYGPEALLADDPIPPLEAFWQSATPQPTTQCPSADA